MTRLFLCGDVMTGRGIDQIQARPSNPALHEPYVSDAREYVLLAEQANGPMRRAVDPGYVWGDALDIWECLQPDARIINLETSVTQSDAYCVNKEIHYRMHPANIECLTRARPDVCVLANNHVLDYGCAGLEETLDVLAAARLKTVGAGRELEEAQRPVIVPLPGDRRVLVAATCAESSGVPASWTATATRAGVDLLCDLSDASADALAGRFQRTRSSGDVAVISIHWGSNWGYDVPDEHMRFARRLIDGGVDVIYGHSSHHPRPIEVYRHRLILYGCGDFIDDYEGIGGYEEFRDDLVLMYFPTLDAHSGEILDLRMAPLRIREMALTHASPADAGWLRCSLDRVCRLHGTRVSAADGMLALHWNRGGRAIEPSLCTAGESGASAS
jgi:poly-gamma-glutamate capsule biosynthesis protein CapA/YwtB (metallophosphatase superfamily)